MNNVAGFGLFGETAFRDNKTGKVFPSGPIHRPSVVPESLRTAWGRLESGFLDKKGKFWTRDDVERKFGGGGESVSMRQRGLFKDRMVPGGWYAKQVRKSSSGDGEVSVSAHERDGHPVQAYTRSKPS